LRDRIRNAKVEVRVIDRAARAEFRVEPRQFGGRLLHELHRVTPTAGGLYLELYFSETKPEHRVGLYRRGTRVLENLADLEPFRKPPWTTGCLEGVVDAGYLNLTPGTRLGIVYDEQLDRLAGELGPIELELLRLIEAQKRAEEERASREVLRSIQSALREALLALPAEEYDWFSLRRQEARTPRPGPREPEAGAAQELPDGAGPLSDPASPEAAGQLQFFDHPGPLFAVRIAPASSVVPVGQTRNLRAVPRDRQRRLVESDLHYAWEICEGEGELNRPDAEIVTFLAPAEPGLTRLRVTVSQAAAVCQAEALITVTDSLIPQAASEPKPSQGLPGYTFEKAPGQLWRSRWDADRQLIVINNGHRDFVYASRVRALKLRYLCRLFAKELVLRNFTGAPPDQLLERMIELTLYAEEHLK
jgi:hypothetical protein